MPSSYAPHSSQQLLSPRYMGGYEQQPAFDFQYRQMDQYQHGFVDYPQ